MTKNNINSAWDHACLPPLQFQIEQHPVAELEVRQATHPWQFVAVVKGRGGPPLFISPWRTGPGKLNVDLRELYRAKGYKHNFAEMVFLVAEVFRDETALSSFTPAGEGDPSCGVTFVNMVNDALGQHDVNHLVMAEPHHQITRRPDFHQDAGWKPVLAGMRTYHIEWLKPQPPESVGVQFKLAGMGHIFMGEGCFYGFLGGNHQYMNPEMPIDTWETQCLKPGAIQLRIYRQEDNELVLIGRSEMVEMAAPGRCRFTLKEPIAAKQGDLLGFYIPSKDTEIAARHGGQMLFLEGAAPESSPSTDWQTEAKIADLAAFRRGDPVRPGGPRADAGLVLQNFPEGKLAYQLFDLAARKGVAEGHFHQRLTLPDPEEGSHFFLIVRP